MTNNFARLTKLKHDCFGADAKMIKHSEAEYTRSLIQSLNGRRREYVEDRMLHARLVLSSISAEERETFLDHLLVTTDAGRFKEFISHQFCREAATANLEFVEWMFSYIEQKKLTMDVWVKKTPTNERPLLDLLAKKRHLYRLIPAMDVSHHRNYSWDGFIELLKLCGKAALEQEIIWSGLRKIEEWDDYGALAMFATNNRIDSSIISSEVQSLIIAREMAFLLHDERDPEFVAEIYSLYSDSELLRIFSQAYDYPQGREHLDSALAHITSARKWLVPA